MKSHCKATSYTCQIKKCLSNGCFVCSHLQPIRLEKDVVNSMSFLLDPMLDASQEHYQKFQDIFGIATTEKYQPSINFCSEASAVDKKNKDLLELFNNHLLFMCKTKVRIH